MAKRVLPRIKINYDTEKTSDFRAIQFMVALGNKNKKSLQINFPRGQTIHWVNENSSQSFYREVGQKNCQLKNKNAENKRREKAKAEMLKNTGEYIESSSDEIHHSEIVIYNAPVTKS